MKDNLPDTELKSKNHDNIDKMSKKARFQLMINSNEEAVLAVKKAENEINEIIDQIYKRLNISKKSRIIYCGAGTSARIAVQDGAELYPTFGWPQNRLDFIIAGDKKALFKPVENAEDDVLNASSLVFKKKINQNDVVIGLAASGNTPFTCQVMEEAKNIGALTVGVSNNYYGLLNKISELSVFLDTGPEVVTGSTRLKAGTAQKICMNIISTGLMIKMGRVKNGEMNFLIATNKKLIKRQIRIKKI